MNGSTTHEGGKELSKRNKFRTPALALLVMSLPLWIGGCLIPFFTGDLFTQNSSQQLCVKVLDDNGHIVPNADVMFTGRTIWRGTRGPVNTTANAVGEACVRVKWPYDIYEVTAFADDGSDDGETVSVLTAFRRDWAGVFAGGALELNTYGVPPKIDRISETRRATFGFIDRTIEKRAMTVQGGHPVAMPPGQPARLLFLDPDNPTGEVRITAEDFTLKLVFGGPGVGIERILEAHLTGTCSIESAFIYSRSATFEAVLWKGASWDYPSFSIEVFVYPHELVYTASGAIQDGGAELRCTGGHGG